MSYDGNNELVHLAYGVCDIENTENWKWFISNLIEDFLLCTCVLGDFDKGLQSNKAQSRLRIIVSFFSRCVRHMQGNCKLSHPIGRGKNRLCESV